MKTVIIIAGLMVAIFPKFTSAENGVLTNIGNFLAGEPCRVPIYHTEFAFPPEGGQIIRIGDQMYFVKTYLPGCENAAAGGAPVSTRTVNQFPQNDQIVSGTETTVVPRTTNYVAPKTGCN
ncbi:MAG: hypothetical protein KW788_03655 [Candidatus Doudnabacteria bacterium]|nr:hypothetical protein [Candidatus Doudnabacteria bacterium]